MKTYQNTLLAQRSDTVTVADGETVSNAFDAREYGRFGLVVPSTFDGTAISFQASHDNSTYQALYGSDNVLVSMTIAASRSYVLPAALGGWRFFKIVCGTSQTGDTVFAVMAQSAAAGGSTSGSAAGSGGVQYAEDAGHTSGDFGNLALAVRNDAAAALSNTDLDYTPLAVDSAGRAKLAAGELHIGEVGGNSAVIRINPTITAGAYSANDVVGGELTITSAMRASGQSGVLQSLYVHDADNEAVELVFYFFESAPTAALADNAPWAWTATDEDLFLGKVTVTAADYAAAGGDSFAMKTNLGIVVKAAGSANLFCYVVTTGTPTYTATTDLTFGFGFLRD